MGAIRKFEDIIAWQKARVLNQKLYKIISDGKFGRDYKLMSQMQSSCGSIMDNIAEGFERSGNKELIQFLFISKGSCGEFRSQCYRAYDNKNFGQEEFAELYTLAQEIIIILQSLITYLLNSSYKDQNFVNRKSDGGQALVNL